MAERRVLIRDKDGREFAVTPAAFRRHADTRYKGFTIDRYEDGTEYQAPKPKPADTDKKPDA